MSVEFHYFFSYSFLGVSQSLPATAYIKMLDIWMIFCILFPFLIVLLFAISEYFENQKNEVKSRANNISQLKSHGFDIGNTFVTKFLDWGIPLISSTFISVFWAFGINNYFWPDVKSSCTV